MKNKFFLHLSTFLSYNEERYAIRRITQEVEEVALEMR